MNMKKKIVAVSILTVLFCVLFSFSASAAEHTHCQCGGVSCSSIAEHDDTPHTWTPIDADDPMPTESGYYYLTEDKDVDTYLRDMPAGADIYLCLNGKRLYLRGAEFINCNLHICDCCGEGSIQPLGEIAYVIWVKDGQLDMYSGTIGASGTKALQASGTSTVNIYSGRIVSSSSNAIDILNGVTCNIYGGEIHTYAVPDNTYVGPDWAFAVRNCGAVNLYGGSIIGNPQAVYMNDLNCKLNIYGGTIQGDGEQTILAQWHGTVNMCGGTISSNADTDDYLIYMDNSGCTFNMSGGSMICEKRPGITQNGVVNVSGGTMTTGGSAFACSGGTISGGTINANLAAKSKYAVQLCGEKFSMSGGKVIFNNPGSDENYRFCFLVNADNRTFEMTGGELISEEYVFNAFYKGKYNLYGGTFVSTGSSVFSGYYQNGCVINTSDPNSYIADAVMSAQTDGSGAIPFVYDSNIANCKYISVSRVPQVVSESCSVIGTELSFKAVPNYDSCVLFAALYGSNGRMKSASGPTVVTSAENRPEFSFKSYSSGDRIRLYVCEPGSIIPLLDHGSFTP